METISSFIDQWLGTALPRLFLLFLGVLLVILVVTALWDRRINRLGGLFGVLTGLFMASIALEESLARFVGGLDPAFRIRLIAALFSLFLLALTLTAWIKTGLQKRYGLTWTAVSLIVLFTALFPSLLRSFPSLLGVHYGVAIAGLFIVFLLLLVFHFSIAISELHRNQQILLQRIRQLEQGKEAAPLLQETEESNAAPGFWARIDWRKLIRRPDRGTAWAAPFTILLAVCAVFCVGMAAPQVMVGDEVTHYYMLKTQANILPQPNFTAEIPTGWGGLEVRTYPHSFGWHYLGAILDRLTGGSFAVIQLYQAMYLAQFLGIAYLLARSRGGVQTRAALPFLLILATIPMTLIFSVTFYQDMPMAAQALTAFWLLRKNRWLLATLFMGFALGVKVTAILFFPAFFVCLLVWTFRRCSIPKTAAICCCSLLLLAICTLGLGRAINTYAHSGFYPADQFRSMLRLVQEKLRPQEKTSAQPAPPQSSSMQPKESAPAAPEARAKVISEQQAEIIANHPGDLRIKANFFVYGGLLLWLLVAAGTAAAVLRQLGLRYNCSAQEKSCWLWGGGLSYALLAAMFVKNAPDARFFLPGLPFLLLPLAEQAVCLPRPKWFISLLAALAILQGGYVLAKTYKLRQVSPELREAIVWLREHPPAHNAIFMYPEGNYRLFPARCEWYLNYYLRQFWRADNELRAAVLRRFGVGAIVIKKYLVAPVDADITNLGVYPDYFVRDVQQDDRFRKVFENSAVVVYQVPAEK